MKIQCIVSIKYRMVSMVAHNFEYTHFIQFGRPLKTHRKSTTTRHWRATTNQIPFYLKHLCDEFGYHSACVICKIKRYIILFVMKNTQGYTATDVDLVLSKWISWWYYWLRNSVIMTMAPRGNHSVFMAYPNTHFPVWLSVASAQIDANITMTRHKVNVSFCSY